MRVELHPVYRVYIHLAEFSNIDLPFRGYYQIRLVAKSNSAYVSTDFRFCEKLSGSSSSLLSAVILDGVAISRTYEVLYADEVLKIGDVFCLNLQFTPQTDHSAIYRLHMDMELWYMDRDRPPQYDLFYLQSRRSLEIDLNPSRLVTVSRVLNFEYSASSSMFFSVFSSLVSIMPRRRKPPPDPPLSQRLKDLHQDVCRALLKSTESIENFVEKQSKYLGSSVHFASKESSSDMITLSSRLESSERPWATLEASAVQLSTRLDTIFDQLLELFGKNEKLAEAQLQEFLDQRLKLLGEAFFFSERPLSGITSTRPSIISELHAQLVKSKYLHKLPRCSVFCADTDFPVDNCPIVFEECFGATSPSTSTRPSTNKMLASGDSLSKRKISKSLRIIPFRRKSTETGLLTRISRPRSSVDSAMPEHNTSPAEDITASPTVTTTSTTSTNGVTENGTSPSVSYERCCESARSPVIPDLDQVELLVGFMKEREAIKSRLETKFDYDGHLYSQLVYNSIRPNCFALHREKSKKFKTHLVVFVHGLEGSKDDLTPYRNIFKLFENDVHFDFLASSANMLTTWTDFDVMSRNLINEIKDYVSFADYEPTKISFIAHSMGGVIVRAALGRSDAEFLYDRLHTLLTINSPHLGLTYAGRGIQWGVQLIRWWKQSRSIEQLSLRDTMSFHNSFLFRLAQNGAFGRFKNVLLVGSPDDLLVPSHSSLLEPCKNSNKDPSALGTAYRDMLASINNDLISDGRPRTVVRYSTFHCHNTAKSTRLTGRAAHLAPIDDDTFIEKLFSISAARYFLDIS